MKHISRFTRHIFTILLTAVLSVTSGAAPVKSMQFKRLNTDNSRLSHNFTTSVVRDSIGFVWIGTTNGLNRYDGQNVRPYYRGELDLPSSAILDLAIDRTRIPQTPQRPTPQRPTPQRAKQPFR